MPSGASARRYAQAVFEIALGGEQLESWSKDLEVVARALESEDLSNLLDAPQVPLERKLDTIRQVVGDTVSHLAANLLSLLASRNTVGMIPEILGRYAELVDAHHGIERADVVSAVELTNEQQQKVSTLLESMVEKSVNLTTSVDNDLLGGFVARVGDRVIDGSTRTKLQGLRRSVVDQIS